ncbi:MAG: PAS domain S-box protein [Myxococcaceae bacterium]
MGTQDSIQPAFAPEQLRLALDGSGVGVWEWDVDSGHVRWSVAVPRLFGLPPGGFSGRYDDYLAFVHEEDRAALARRIGDTVEGRSEEYAAEYRIVQPDGTVRWMGSRGRMLGRTRRMAGAVWDITGTKQLEAHAARLQQIRAMAGDVQDMLARSRGIDLMFREACRIAIEKGQFRFAWVGLVDEVAERVLPVASFGHADGYLDAIDISTRDVPAGRGPTGTSIREDRTVVFNDVEHEERMAPWRAAALLRGYRAVGAFPLHRGARVVGALNIYADQPRLFDPDAVLLLERLASNLSLTLEQLELDAARRRAEEAVRQSESRLRTLIEQAADAILIVDRDGRVVDLNPAASLLLGYPDDALLGVSAGSLIASSAPPEVTAQLTALGPGESLNREVRFRRRDRDEVPVEIKAKRLPDRRQQAIARDLTERQRLQARLVMADRLSAIGVVAAGVAHQISTPLSYLRSNLSYVQEELERLAREHPLGELQGLLQALGDAREGSEQVCRIIGDLKTFSRGEGDRRAEVSLPGVLDSAVNMVRLSLPNRASLVKEYGALPLIEGNESRLAQLFLNLLVNAVQAIPEGSEAAHQIKVATRTDPYGRAVVEISDTGQGIAPEILGRIFDPFFTTRPAGAGTGLGLPISQEIVTSHRGSLQVESRPGGGTRFRVVLPQRPGARAGPEPGAAREAKAGAMRLLIVDDEPTLCRAIGRVLKRHQVELASGGREALAKAAEGSFDAVLCDLMMPGMNGMEVFEELKKASPGLERRMVFMTGGSFSSAAARFLSGVPNARLEKPLDFTGLEAVLAAAAVL